LQRTKNLVWSIGDKENSFITTATDLLQPGAPHGHPPDPELEGQHVGLAPNAVQRKKLCQGPML